MHRSIVVGTDGSAPSEAAVREAVDIAACDGARLHIVAAYPDPERYGERITSGADRVMVNVRDVAEGMLERAAREAEAKGLEVETHARDGHAAETILQVAAEQQADLIVVGDRGQTGIPRFPLGGVAQKVSHHADCSVMIVRSG
jgi:nucleotide-binding universal stress UspA family protein